MVDRKLEPDHNSILIIPSSVIRIAFNKETESSIENSTTASPIVDHRSIAAPKPTKLAASLVRSKKLNRTSTVMIQPTVTPVHDDVIKVSSNAIDISVNLLLPDQLSKKEQIRHLVLHGQDTVSDAVVKRWKHFYYMPLNHLDSLLS